MGAIVGQCMGLKMIVYLDQNKWIELARMMHGRDDSARAKRIVKSIEQRVKDGVAILPLSAIHYMETARISNEGRKSRLGAAMWHFSKGVTIASYTAVVQYELDVALSRNFAHIVPDELKLLGFGITHAFGQPAFAEYKTMPNPELERLMLMGSDKPKIPPLEFRDTNHRANFQAHLLSLHSRAAELNRELRENFLYAISMVDIIEPFNRAIVKYELPANLIETLGKNGMTALIEGMPTRRVDLHLHKQVLRNPNYSAKPSDLEDWAALAIASCYCDIVVCEKHMVDMLQRDGFRTQSRIERDLESVLN